MTLEANDPKAAIAAFDLPGFRSSSEPKGAMAADVAEAVAMLGVSGFGQNAEPKGAMDPEIANTIFALGVRGFRVRTNPHSIQPEHDCGEMDECEVVDGKSVVSGREAAAMLEPVEAAFDAVAQPVDGFVVWDRALARTG